jgi:two-component system CheB/CheR fusion protein
VIDGVVITFVDIDRVKRAEKLAASRSLAQSIVETVREPLVVLDDELRIATANKAFLYLLRLGDADVASLSIFEVGGDAFSAPRLQELLRDVVARGHIFQDWEFEHDFPGVGHRRLRVNARRLETESAPTGHVLMALEDVTSRRGPSR